MKLLQSQKSRFSIFQVKQNKKCKAITSQAISTKVEHFFFDKIKNARQSLFKQFQQKRNNFFFGFSLKM